MANLYTDNITCYKSVILTGFFLSSSVSILYYLFSILVAFALPVVHFSSVLKLLFHI
jgi:hypothetical protein